MNNKPPMKCRHGVYYFTTRDMAAAFAQSIHAPAHRIVEYQRGYAIQWHTSGPYVGPTNLTHSGCEWCDSSRIHYYLIRAK